MCRVSAHVLEVTLSGFDSENFIVSLLCSPWLVSDYPNLTQEKRSNFNYGFLYV